MARGSSYGEKPTESPLAVPMPTNIPRRATREIQPVQVREELETQPVRAGRNKRLPETSVGAVTRELKTRYEDEYDDEMALEPVPRKYKEPSPLLRHHLWLNPLLISMGCVVVGAFVLISASVYMRSSNNVSQAMPYSAQSFPIQLGGSYDAFNLWHNSNGPIPAKTPLPKNPGPYSVLGKPTITAAFINTVLATYHSPTAGMGQALYDYGVKYGIDPVYPLAFFMHESLFGTTGEARATLSLGNSRCIEDRPCIDKDRGGYAKMNSWQDGFEQWYKLIRNLYVAQWGLVTVDQIIPR